MTLANIRPQGASPKKGGDIHTGQNITEKHPNSISAEVVTSISKPDSNITSSNTSSSAVIKGTSIDFDKNIDIQPAYLDKSAPSFFPGSASINSSRTNTNNNSDHDDDDDDAKEEVQKVVLPKHLSSVTLINDRSCSNTPSPTSAKPKQDNDYSATVAIDTNDEVYGGGAFEGPEKLLEIWFNPKPATAHDDDDDDQNNGQKQGLRKVPEDVWREMLDLVHCQILNVVCNAHFDAYLLSESSLFVFPHKLILKTCGTTTLLYAVQKILDISRELCGLTSVDHVFYSRKSFMFPEKQPGPHRSWEQEVKYLDDHFENGAAYLIGKQNADCWHLYMANGCRKDNKLPKRVGQEQPQQQQDVGSGKKEDDITIEILMTGLSQERMQCLYLDNLPSDVQEGTEGGAVVAKKLGLDQIYPNATLDSYLFSPCGFSMNGLQDGQYITVHVTPEPECSYASYETNILTDLDGNIAISASDSDDCDGDGKKHNLVSATKYVRTLVGKVVNAFDPEHVTVTIFKSRPNTNGDNAGEEDDGGIDDTKDQPCNIPSIPNYKTKDRILYEYDGYWLRYADFSRVLTA
ncbi:spermidine resistance protein [Mycoemilia scoparia]|uniref:adenosylmethionine decarboxylase n=1 Tax=Mycoemilia scoparia TaxID=417184 RepID=A0A9W8DN27_9FUNG|nr:spermidine resistance protein [Mycoemilia scoparia]